MQHGLHAARLAKHGAIQRSHAQLKLTNKAVQFKVAADHKDAVSRRTAWVVEAVFHINDRGCNDGAGPK